MFKLIQTIVYGLQMLDNVTFRTNRFHNKQPIPLIFRVFLIKRVFLVNKLLMNLSLEILFID